VLYFDFKNKSGEDFCVVLSRFSLRVLCIGWTQTFRTLKWVTNTRLLFCNRTDSSWRHDVISCCILAKSPSATISLFSRQVEWAGLHASVVRRRAFSSFLVVSRWQISSFLLVLFAPSWLRVDSTHFALPSSLSAFSDFPLRLSCCVFTLVLSLKYANVYFTVLYTRGSGVICRKVLESDSELQCRKISRTWLHPRLIV